MAALHVGGEPPDLVAENDGGDDDGDGRDNAPFGGDGLDLGLDGNHGDTLAHDRDDVGLLPQDLALQVLDLSVGGHRVRVRYVMGDGHVTGARDRSIEWA